MKTTARTLKVVTATTLMALIVLAYPRPAQALFGIDFSDIIKAINEVRGKVDEVKSAIQATQNGLNGLGYEDLRLTLQHSYDELNAFQDDIDNIGYTEENIQQQWDTLFPKDPTTWQNVRYEDYDSLYSGWLTQSLASSKAAAHAQVALANAHDDSRKAMDILQASQNGDSNTTVKQLQISTQMLTMMQANLGNIQMSLVSQGRVVSEMAARSVSEKAADREMLRRRVEHYGEPHESPNVLSALPPVQGR